MKKVLIITFACILVCYVNTEAKPKRSFLSPMPQPSPWPDLVCRTKQQDSELRDWITGIQGQATAAVKDAEAAKQANMETGKLLATAKRDADTYARQCQGAFECAKAPLSCWFHRFTRHILWIGGTIVLLLVGLCIASFFFPALTPVFIILKKLWDMIIRKPMS